MRSVIPRSSQREPNPYFVELGRKGGLAGKGSERKRLSAVKAAATRWSRTSVPLKITVYRGRATFSRRMKQLAACLKFYDRKKVDGIVTAKKQVALFHDDGLDWTFPSLLDRVTGFLAKQNIVPNVKWVDRPTYIQARCDFQAASFGFNYRQQRDLKRLLKLPFGGVCDVSESGRLDVIIAVLQGYKNLSAIVVVEEIARLEHLRKALAHRLHKPIGILTAQHQDSERVTLMTPHYLNSRIIGPDEGQIMIFDRIPRTGRLRYLAAMSHVQPLWKLGFLGDEARGPDRLFISEMDFGPIVTMTEQAT